VGRAVGGKEGDGGSNFRGRAVPLRRHAVPPFVGGREVSIQPDSTLFMRMPSAG
jgi:hypothetical protein